MENLLEKLNKEQLEAVMHREGPLLIVAGAGTGKTTAITQRIAWLIEQGIAKPEQILALTFTDKAAGEMEERVDLLLPMGYLDLQISTFHSFAETLLRQYGVEMGLSRDFRIVSELDAWLLARQSIDQFELTYYRPLGNPTKYIRALLTHFSRAKDAGISPDQYASFVEAQRANLDSAQANDEATVELNRLQELAQAYQTYQRILLSHDALDFGDLMLYTLRLLKERPNVLEEIRKRFTYVLVDEFQDTNAAQYEIVKLIAAPKNNLTVVGDDDQSIYKFRGASIENILQFQTDYPEAKRIVLTQNYRSAQGVLDTAYEFIQKNNPRRLEAQDKNLSKRLTASREQEAFIEHMHCTSFEEEARAVVERLHTLRAQHPDAGWDDFAILVRSNDTAGPFVAALERARVPYHFLALSGLYLKPTVLDLLAFLRVVDNPYDSPSMYRLLTLALFQIPQADISDLTHLANRKGKSLFEACHMARGFLTLSDTGRTGIDRILSLMNTFREEARKRHVAELFIIVAKESGYVEYISGQSEQAQRDQFRLLQQFYERIKRFEETHDHPVLHNFLEAFRHERDAGEEGSLAFDIETGPETVKIMTVHAAKGLEFRFVFVVSLVDQRFPTRARPDSIPMPSGLTTSLSGEGDWHLEEERRLFYVAMTRAKDGLFFTSADHYGGTRKRKLSRFLDELGYTKPETGPAQERNIFTESASSSTPATKTTTIIHLPKQFSFTQLAAFKTCPLQYKFAHVLKVPVFGKWTFSFGKTMHNTLQEFFTRWIERTNHAQASLFASPPPIDDAFPVSMEELLKIYEEKWLDDWYMDDRQREQYRAKGRESLRGFVSSFETNLPHPTHLELPFTLKIGSVVVKGRIDRVDAVEGGVEVIDYKTGSPKKLEDLDRGGKEQLYLYQIAIKDILGLEPVRLTFHYLEDNSRVSFLGSSEDLQRLREDITTRVEQIRTSSFAATSGFHCRFCDFQDICEFKAS